MSISTSVECPECGRVVGNNAGLSAHMRSQHGGPLMPSTGTSVPPPSATELVWEAPPARGRKRHVEKLAGAVVELRRRPGEWARIHTFPSNSGAGQIRKPLMEAYPDCEFHAGRIGERGSAIWARFVDEA